MGLIVPELVTPDGRTLSNAYVSFHNSVVYTLPVTGQDYPMCAWGVVYESIEHVNEPPVFRFEIKVENTDVKKGPFANLYTALKRMFPEGVDHYVEGQE
jgi:hypothetical protein